MHLATQRAGRVPAQHHDRADRQVNETQGDDEIRDEPENVQCGHD
jgi:hypothetical protein